MKTDQQHRFVYYLLAPAMVVIFASSWISWKYPEYFDYAMAGLGIFALLLFALAIFMVKNKTA